MESYDPLFSNISLFAFSELERIEKSEVARLLEQPTEPDNSTPQSSKTERPAWHQPYDKEALEELQLKSMFMENIRYHAERLDDYMYAGGDGRVNKRQEGFDRYDVLITLALTAMWLTLYALFYKLYYV